MIPRVLLGFGVLFTLWSMLHSASTASREKLLEKSVRQETMILPSRRRFPKGDGTYPG